MLHRPESSNDRFFILVSDSVLFLLIFDLLAKRGFESSDVLLAFDILIDFLSEIIQQKHGLAVDFHCKGGSGSIIIADGLVSNRASCSGASCVQILQSAGIHSTNCVNVACRFVSSFRKMCFSRDSRAVSAVRIILAKLSNET